MRAVAWDKSLAGLNYDAAGTSVFPEKVERLWMYLVLAGMEHETYGAGLATSYSGLANAEAVRIGLG